MTDFEYSGSELSVFAGATCWKSYVRRLISPWLGDEVLEVGAGIGGSTAALCPPGIRRWVCLEPDGRMAADLAARIAAGDLPACCEATRGGLRNLPATPTFDSILYLDVLEHIEDDGAEVREAFRRLRPSGHLVILAPAHAWLYTPFDESIGHFPRYTVPSLRALLPPAACVLRADYLDAAGLLSSLANRFVLRSGTPTAAQVLFWDRILVRLSQLLDPVLGNRVGKSVLMVVRRQTAFTTALTGASSVAAR